MLKVDLNHVIKNFVECLLPTGSGDSLLAVSLRVDTWLNVDEESLTPEAFALIKAAPERFADFCQLSDRYHEVFVFSRPMAYTKVWRQQPSTSAVLTLAGTYDKVADHDSQWIEGVTTASDRAFETVQAMREKIQRTVQPQHLARARPGQTIQFAQTPALITGYNAERINDLLTLRNT